MECKIPCLSFPSLSFIYTLITIFLVINAVSHDTFALALYYKVNIAHSALYNNDLNNNK